MTQSVTLSNEQFQQLLATLKISGEQTSAVTTQATISRSGSFAKCSSRFNGSKEADVKAFIYAIEYLLKTAQISQMKKMLYEVCLCC